MKTGFIWILMLMFFLVGCTTDQENIPRRINTDDSFGVIDDSKYIEIFDTFLVADYSTQFDFSSQSLDTYQDKRYPGIHYVNLAEYLNVMKPVLNDFELDISKQATITVPFYLDGIESSYADFQLTINPIINTLYYNDFNFQFAISGFGSRNYDTDIVMTDYTIEDSKPLYINLNAYSLDILYSEGSIYIPFDLANLILTGYSINLYREDMHIYVVDDFNNIKTSLLNPWITMPDDEFAYMNYTRNFTSLLFDYFYGLKSHHEVDTYKKTFNELEYRNSSSVVSQTEKFQEFIYDIDDLHTSIIYYGYNGDEVSKDIKADYNSNISEYRRQYLNNCMHAQTIDGLKWRVYDDYYVLEIVEFNIETKDKLKNSFKNLDPDKDIYIDLTCNGGGAVISVVELLLYMTNEPIVLSYKNATTGTIYHETYQSSAPKALLNNFILMTSRLTYSAANLLTSIVKDMNLAVIVGTPAMGGAAVVTYGVLPNNLIMSYSTTKVFLDKNNQIIEDGIEPDYLLKSVLPYFEYASKMKSFYIDHSTYKIDDYSTLDKLHLSLEITDFHPEMVINRYTIYYKDSKTMAVIDTFETNDLNFMVNKNIIHNQNLIEVEVIAHYILYGQTFKEIIYTHIIDEFSDTIDQNTKTLPLGVTYHTTKHSETDIDFVRIEIVETGVYLFYVNDTKHFGHKHEVYSDSGQKLMTGTDFSLSPGVYYIKVDMQRLDYDYSIKLEKLISDDN